MLGLCSKEYIETNNTNFTCPRIVDINEVKIQACCVPAVGQSKERCKLYTLAWGALSECHFGYHKNWLQLAGSASKIVAE